MTLRVVGAGLGRTGTHSQKLALERLLGGPCYHMIETFGRPDDISVWHRAIDGDVPDWEAFLADYVAAVDWPACAFWRELSDAFPDALVLLSTRDVDSWWTSASSTIFEALAGELSAEEIRGGQQSMVIDLFFKRFTPLWQDEDEAKAAFVAHNEAVRAAIPKERLVEWQPGDGWEPICNALGLPVPDEPYPHVNTTADFRTMTGMDG
jgi:hypothetical protein